MGVETVVISGNGDLGQANASIANSVAASEERSVVSVKLGAEFGDEKMV